MEKRHREIPHVGFNCSVAENEKERKKSGGREIERERRGVIKKNSCETCR
jgi:hypothetical protein